MCRISSQSILSYSEVSRFMGSLNWASGLVPLGRLYLRPLQHHFLFVRTDKPVYTAMLSDPLILATLLRQWRPIFSNVRNPYPIFPGIVHDFHRRLYPGLGRPLGGFPDCECFDQFRMRAPHQFVGAEGSNIGPQTLGCSITGPSCYDHYRQYHCCSLYQQQGGTHSHTLLRLEVDLFLWLDSGYNYLNQTHSGLPQCISRPVISAEPAHHNRVESPPRGWESNIQTVGYYSSGQVCHSP